MDNEPIEGEVVRKPDSFDVGQHYVDQGQIQGVPAGGAVSGKNAALAALLANPGFINQLGLTPKQKKHVRSMIGAAGAGLSMELLASTFGPIIAGAIGGALGGYVSTKVIKDQ
jgi:hypothetical protein